MLQTLVSETHPTPEQLGRLQLLDRLEPDALAALAAVTTVHHARRGSTLVELGEPDDHLLFLIEGEVELRAADGAARRIRHDEPSGRAPIARLRPSRYHVTALTPVSYVMLPADTVTNDPSPEALPTIEVQEIDNAVVGEDDGLEEQLTCQLYEDLNSQQLLLPSLPEVATRVGRAVQHELADAQRVARVIENDPAITAKLIRIANSARYGGARSIATLPEAIARIGLETTHRLVISFALRELFRCRAPALARRMQHCWNRARQVGAICHVLARRCPGPDPEVALLAGLVHNLGEVALLTYARDFPALIEDTQRLDLLLRGLGPQLTTNILERWEFQDALVTASEALGQAGSDVRCEYGDLLLIALNRLDAPDHESPAVTDACERLRLPDCSPGAIAELLEEARREVRELFTLLGE